MTITEAAGCMFCDRIVGPHIVGCPAHVEPAQPDLMACGDWPNNDSLIRDVVDFYIVPRFSQGADVIDTTWGEGKWWKLVDVEREFRRFVAHDLKTDGVDMTDLPHDDNTFDFVFYDPPYVSVGGRTTTGISKFFDDYGLGDAPTTPAELQRLMDRGLAEAYRIVRPQGLVFMKCQNYVSSGKLWLGEFRSIQAGLSLGARVYDLIHHRSGTGPQPEGRAKVHARCNESVMIAFQKGGRRVRRNVTDEA